VRVRVYATLRNLVGDRVIELPMAPGATALDVAKAMVARWPETAELLIDEREGVTSISKRAHVFIEGRSARHLPDGEHTVIQEGQEVDVSPAVAGG